MLRNVKVSGEIAKLRQKACNKLEISTENVLRELARLAFLDARKFYDANGALRNVTELDDDTAACIAGMEAEDVYEGYGDERKKVRFVARSSSRTKARISTA